MRYVIGDIWDWHATHPIVVPTNIGWTRRGLNVMGRGVALQASMKFPYLSDWYGKACMAHREGTPVVYHPAYRLLLFPVKPLDCARPWESWAADADHRLIERSAEQLSRFSDQLGTIALPLVGCGNGGLLREDVVPILEEYLHDSFVLVEQ